MATFKAILNNKPKADGTYSILLRITEKRKLKHIGIGYSINKKNWNENASFEKSNWVSKTNPQYKVINSTIKNKISEASNIELNLTVNNQTFSSSILQKSLKGEISKSFLSYADSLLKQYEQNKSVVYHKILKTTLFKLKTYLKGKDLCFEDITVSFLKEYETHLFSIGNATNTVHSNLKRIRAIINEAIREDLFPFEKNPFLKFALKTAKTNKEKLTEIEIKKLFELSLDKNSPLWHYRNFFLFSFYCAGIRSADFIKLKWKYVQEGRLIYQMGKTDKTQSIKLIPKALEILAHYNTSTSIPEDFIFPLLDNSKDYTDRNFLYSQVSSKNALINKNLKTLAEKTGIAKNLSFHIARHSFADIGRQKGGSIYDISKALNHSNIKITEVYLSSMDEKAQDKLFDTIFEEPSPQKTKVRKKGIPKTETTSKLGDKN